MKQRISIVILLFLALQLSGQVTTIRGTVTGKQSGLVRLIAYADQVSYKKITLAADEIAHDGSFALSVDLPGTTYALLEIDYQQGELFLGPGMEYHLRVIPDTDIGQKAYYDRTSLEIFILDEPDDGINHLISKINMAYDGFLIENAHLAQSPGRKDKLNGFIQDLEANAERISDAYLDDYIRYKVASLEMFFRVSSDEKLAAEYLTGKPVLYSNVEYMDFFHLYFEKYLLTNNPHFPYSKTSALVNGDGGLDVILDELSKDPVLADDRLAEMVLLSGLKEMAGNPGFEQPRVLYLLDRISEESPYKENKAIAKNLKERLLWMKPGSPAPGFTLNDTQGKVHRLEDYRGKYIYLSFISLNSPASLAEMNLLADIRPDFDHRYHFVSIITDRLPPGWPQIIRDYRMDWDLLTAVGDLDLFDSYGATAPPLFLLIDPAGRIARYPAPSPSEELKGFLEGF